MTHNPQQLRELWGPANGLGEVVVGGALGARNVVIKCKT